MHENPLKTQEIVKFYTLAARKVGKMTCEEFGKPLGVRRQWVSNWERNGQLPDARTLWLAFKKNLGEPYRSWSIALLKLHGIDLGDVVDLVHTGTFRSSDTEYQKFSGLS